MAMTRLGAGRGIWGGCAGVAGVALSLCLVFAAPLSASATVLQRFDTATISRAATVIVVGTVVSTASELEGSGVRTAVRMSVTDPIKGSGPGTVTFYVPGGMYPDGRRVIVEGMATFTAGESACVFVDDRGWVYGGSQGKVDISGGRVTTTGQLLAVLTKAVRSAISDSSAVAPLGFVDPLADQPQAVTIASADGPTVTSISPGEVAAGVGDRITITGSGFGPSRGAVSFFYQIGEPRISAKAIVSWSDTEIVCEVPVDTVNGYSASPGSGPIVVTTATGVSTTSSQRLAISFGYGRYRWAADPSTHSTRVSYRVNPGGIAGSEAAVDSAAAVWNAAGANFRFVDGGTTSAGSSMTSLDGHNDIGWAGGLPSGVIAQAMYAYNWNGELIESHVTFSTGFAWGDGSGRTMDIQSIATHEIGHWLSLRDLYGSGDSSKVMYGYSDFGDVKRTLSSGDTAGIIWIYGAGPAVDDSSTPADSSTAVVTAKAVPVLTTPSAPSKVRRRAKFSVSGYLKPGVVAGTNVTLRLYRYESGHWKLRKTVTTRAYGYSTFSKYSVKTSVPSAGKWRVRAYCSATSVSGYSAYRKLSAR